MIEKLELPRFTDEVDIFDFEYKINEIIDYINSHEKENNLLVGITKENYRLKDELNKREKNNPEDEIVNESLYPKLNEARNYEYNIYDKEIFLKYSDSFEDIEEFISRDDYSAVIRLYESAIEEIIKEKDDEIENNKIDYSHNDFILNKRIEEKNLEIQNLKANYEELYKEYEDAIERLTAVTNDQPKIIKTNKITEESIREILDKHESKIITEVGFAITCIDSHNYYKIIKDILELNKWI